MHNETTQRANHEQPLYIHRKYIKYRTFITATNPVYLLAPFSLPAVSCLLSKEYLSAAVRYLEGDAGRISVNRIKGIWVASDDPAVLDEVRSIAPEYFPNTNNDTIVKVSDGQSGGPGVAIMPTRTDSQVGSQNTYHLTAVHTFTVLYVKLGNVHLGDS